MSIGAKIMSFRYKRHQGKEEIILNVMPPLNIMGEGGGHKSTSCKRWKQPNLLFHFS